MTGEPELIRLPNGVRIALDPMPLETASLGIWIRVGARWERAEENGVAHLFEHMAFKGAGGRDARHFAEAVESVGAIVNAATSYERTAYYARTLKRDVGFLFELLADVVRAPHWQEEDLEKEKGVVAQERGEAFDQPDDRVFELHQSAVFRDQPLGRPVLGEAESLAGVRIATLEAFRAAHYAPARIVIAVAGGYDRAEILARAEARFGDLATGPAEAPLSAAPRGGVAAEARKLEQAHTVLSWPAPAAGSGDIFAARLLAEIYGGGMASRLFQDVRESRGLVYAIDSYLETYEDAGRLGVYAGCGAVNAGLVAERATAILGELAEHGPTAKEMQRAKAVVGAQMLMGAEAPSARAEARASQVFLRDRLLSFSEIAAQAEAVTAEAVQAAARTAAEGVLAVGAVGPRAGVKAVEAFMARFV
ncbi:MAG: M16 family metallopeptidase [Hyphomonadaceae bacterium]